VIESSCHKKIKILYVLPEFGTGGAERLVVDLCRLLSSERFEASVCVFKSGSFEPEILGMGKDFHLLPAAFSTLVVGKGILLFKRLLALRTIIRCNSIDIVHTNFMGPLSHINLVQKLPGVEFRWVHTEHNAPDATIYSAKSVKRTRDIYPRVDAAVGITDVVSNYYRDQLCVPLDKIRTIYNGIPLKKFVGCDREAKRKALGFTPSDKLIGIIANLRPVKNHATLLRAFGIMSAELADAHLVLVGDGETREGLESLARELGLAHRIHFLGARLDAHEIMQILDLYCLPSTYEGLPLSVLEAWAAGKPVVGTDVKGIRDLITHQKNGILVPLEDPAALSESIVGVFRDEELQARLARNGSLKVKQFDASQMIAQYEQLYLDLV